MSVPRWKSSQSIREVFTPSSTDNRPGEIISHRPRQRKNRRAYKGQVATLRADIRVVRTK
jgi:hypothetical protein